MLKAAVLGGGDAAMSVKIEKGRSGRDGVP